LIAGEPLISYTLRAFQDSPQVDEIVLVVRPDELSVTRDLVESRGFSKVKSITPGGEVRQDSVRNGLAEVSADSGIVAIHDGARPLITRETIASTIEAADTDGAAIAAVPVIDTIKSSLDGLFVNSTLDRQTLYAVQTPQTFQRGIIMEAYDRAYADCYYGTDDACLVERLGIPVRIVQGSYENIKVTTPTDLRIAESLLSPSPHPPIPPSLRIGHGYDVHRFAAGRKLFLGGMEFPGDGLLGHSDADVLLHAVADAVLGAAGAGDIGRLFPDTDPAYKDARSMDLLAKVGEVVRKLGWTVGNVDVTLIAQKPKIADHILAMQANIARTLGIDPGRVSVKGKTAEGLGPIGESLGIECHAVALLMRNE
jgi:2-C-methyl-D-erythritol 4-phosphate cytidylyltransferase/2-C-methyl-D-erythritol 2,4-cyclodiphosphate synthase